VTGKEKDVRFGVFLPFLVAGFLAGKVDEILQPEFPDEAGGLVAESIREPTADQREPELL
jgi:hypothetical protein